MIDKLQVGPEDPGFLAALNRRLEEISNSLQSTQTPAVVEASGGRTGYSGTRAQRLVLPAYSLPFGTPWYESDTKCLYMVVSDGSTNARVWRYASGDQRGLLAAKPTALTAVDVGCEYYATDYYRLYRWTGSAWEYAPGEPPGRFTTLHPGTLPAGWAVCNGSVVTLSKADGTTESFTTPDIIGEYIKGGTYTGSVVAAVTGTITGNTGAAGAHSHGAGSLVTTASGSGGTAVAGAGITVVGNHAHGITGSTDGAIDHTHDQGSLALTGSPEPSHYLLLPIIKL